MVSTRHHPNQFAEPDTPTATTTSRSNKPTPSKTSAKATSTSPVADVAKGAHVQTYTHTVHPVVIVWLFISMPLVIWDIGYVLLRPHSMPGGKFHFPVWSPYALYGQVDYVYGFPAWDNGVGFTAAQSVLNLAETLMYLYYFYIIASRGKGTGWFGKLWTKKASKTDVVAVKGQGVAFAVLVGYAAAVMTLSKTVLYWLNEYFSNFDNIGHNSASTIFWIWIVPNGAWLVVPSRMVYLLGKEIVSALNKAGFS